MAGIRAVFCFVGIEMPEHLACFLWVERKWKKTATVKVASWEPAKFPLKSLGPGIMTVIYSCHRQSLRPPVICAKWTLAFQGLKQDPPGCYLAHLQSSRWVCAKFARYTPDPWVSGKPETEWGEGTVRRIQVSGGPCCPTLPRVWEVPSSS